MLSDTDLFVNRFISVPKNLGQLNCAAFVAGIIKGVLQGAGFPARLTPPPKKHPTCCVLLRLLPYGFVELFKGMARICTKHPKQPLAPIHPPIQVFSNLIRAGIAVSDL